MIYYDFITPKTETYWPLSLDQKDWVAASADHYVVFLSLSIHDCEWQGKLAGKTGRETQWNADGVIQPWAGIQGCSNIF